MTNEILRHREISMQEWCQVIYDWHSGAMEHFWKHLLDAISVADNPQNRRLARGYPELVELFREYQHIPDKVQFFRRWGINA